MQETGVRSLGWEDHLEKEMTTHSSTFAWKILWTEESGRLQLQRVGQDWVTSLIHSPGPGGIMLPFKNVLDLTLKILFNHISWACILILCIKNGKYTYLPSVAYQSIMVILKKNVHAIVWELATFFMEYYFYLKEWLTNYCYSDLGSGRHFLEHKQSKPVTSKKTTDNDCCQW